MTETSAAAPPDRTRLERLWHDHAAAVHAYVRRREPELADEVCAETFAVAWRRLADVPQEARPWLIGVARNVLRTARRAAGRRAALTERLVADLPPVAVEPLDDPDVGDMLARLGELDRELVLLVYWDGLSPAEAGRVVGIRPAAARTRLWRARRRLRTLLLIGAVVLLVGGGLALAGALGVRYFDASAPVPPSVQADLRDEASRYDYPGPHRRLDAEHALVAYDVGALTVYVAPYEGGGGGWCGAAYRAGTRLGGACVPPVIDRMPGNPLAVALGGATTLWHWYAGPQDDARAIVGRLPAGAAPVQLQVGFEDGSTTDLAQHDRWFAVAFGARNLVAGHRPAEVLALDAGGHVVASQRFDPVQFTARAAALAQVRAGNGSPGQAAIRRMLLDTTGQDGGHEASLVDVSDTRLVRSLPLDDGSRIDVYADEGRADASYPSGLLLVAGVHEPGGDSVFGHGGVGGDGRFSAFLDVAGGAITLPGTEDSPYLDLYGQLPRGVTQVAVRLEDGRERPADLIARGEWEIFLERAVYATPGHRPVGLVGRDASGAVVVTTRLDPGSCLHEPCRPIS